MNRFFKSLIAAGTVCACALSANAQLGTNTSVAVGAVGGVVSTPLSLNGTNTIAGPGTNFINGASATGFVLPVAQHPNVGVTLGYNCLTSATNGNLVISGFRSYDNAATYETTAGIKLTNALPTAVQFAAGTTNFVVEYDVTVNNATHILWSNIVDTAAAGTVTNLYMSFNLNNGTTWTVPATR